MIWIYQNFRLRDFDWFVLVKWKKSIKLCLIYSTCALRVFPVCNGLSTMTRLINTNFVQLRNVIVYFLYLLRQQVEIKSNCLSNHSKFINNLKKNNDLNNARESFCGLLSIISCGTCTETVTRHVWIIATTRRLREQ